MVPDTIQLDNSNTVSQRVLLGLLNDNENIKDICLVRDECNPYKIYIIPSNKCGICTEPFINVPFTIKPIGNYATVLSLCKRYLGKLLPKEHINKITNDHYTVRCSGTTYYIDGVQHLPGSLLDEAYKKKTVDIQWSKDLLHIDVHVMNNTLLYVV